MIHPFSLLVLEFKLVNLFHSALIYSCFKINKEKIILLLIDPVLVDIFLEF